MLSSYVCCALDSYISPYVKEPMAFGHVNWLTRTWSKLSYLLPAVGLLFTTTDVQVPYTQETVVASTDVTGS